MKNFFHITTIPKDSQLRQVLDDADNAHVYEHQILQAVIVCPGIREVIPLAPEPIANSDGAQKQDCEINAAKRLISKLRCTHSKLKLIVTGDSLYSKQPFIDSLKAAGMAFILVAKPDDHKILLHERSTASLIDARLLPRGRNGLQK